LTAGIAGLLLIAAWGGTTYAWTSPQIAGLAVAVFVLFMLFRRAERRADEPMLPLHLFRDRIPAVANLAIFFLGAVIFVLLIYVPVFAQGVLGSSATSSGVILMPLNFAWIAASMLSGRLISRTGRYRVFPIVGTALVVAGTWLLTRLGAASSGLELS